MRNQQKAGFALNSNVILYSFNADKVRSFDEFKALSEHEKIKAQIDKGHNLVVDAGAAQIANLMLGLSSTAFTYCGVGSSTTAVSAGQTDLQTPIARTAVTSPYRAVNEAHYDTFFGSSTGNGTWNETGIFTASSAGTMLARKVLSSAFAKSTSNTAVVAWTVTLTPV